MPEHYEVLKEMGFDSSMEIERYTVRTEGDMDILKIYLRKQSGDWFSKSKKFKFRRADKSLERGASYGEATEPSSYFLKAVAELEKLVKHEHDTATQKEILLDEIDHLEKVMTRKLEDIKRQIEAL